jgi:hypothetical protein
MKPVAYPPPVSSRWVTAQKATPSFASASDSAGPSALDAPLPAALAPFEAPAAADSRIGSAATPRGRAPSPRVTSPTSPTPGRAQTPPARGFKSVHEDLIERGRLYQQRKEALQEKALRKEIARCRSVPKVSLMARQLERSEPIITRLYKLENEKRKMAEYKQMETDRREEKIFEHLFKPKLSRRGQRTQGRTMRSQHDLWDYKREARIQDQRLAQIAREMSTVQDAPEINTRSEMLAAKRREAEGMAGYSHFEAMLERDRLAKLAQWEKEQLRRHMENPGTPRITELAARMQSDMNVVDRLYARAQQREEKLAHLAESIAQEREAEARASPAAAAPGGGFGGGLTPAPRHHHHHHQHHHYSASPSPDPGDDRRDVYERNADFARDREARLQRMRDDEDARHRPVLDPTSVALASRMDETTQDRLLRPRTPTRGRPSTPLRGASATPVATGPRPTSPAASARRTPPPAGAVSPTPSGGAATPGTPTTRATPGEARASSSTAAAVYERMMTAERQRQRRLEAARADQDRHLAEDLTFAPKLSQGTSARAAVAAPAEGGAAASPVAAPAAAAAGRSPAVQRIYDRTMQWARKRDERVDAAKADRERAELNECTFEPDTSAAEARLAHDAGLYGGDGRAWGYDDYVNRMQAARTSTGATSAPAAGGPPGGATAGAAAASPWATRGPTVPVTFNLGKQDVRVSALQPPVRPPLRDPVAGESADPAIVRAMADRLLVVSSATNYSGGNGARPANYGGGGGPARGDSSRTGSDVYGSRLHLGNASTSEPVTAIDDDDDDDEGGYY